jgi:hypothetical protein
LSSAKNPSAAMSIDGSGHGEGTLFTNLQNLVGNPDTVASTSTQSASWALATAERLSGRPRCGSPFRSCDQGLRLRIQRSACRIVNAGSAAGRRRSRRPPLVWDQGRDVTHGFCATMGEPISRRSPRQRGNAFVPPFWSAYDRTLSEAWADWLRRRNTAVANRAFWDTSCLRGGEKSRQTPQTADLHVASRGVNI